jgi:Mycothiol maleylpyruvate isomerase N-terminal domain
MTTPLVGEPPGWSVPSWGPSDWQVSVRHEARGGCSGPPGRGAGALRHAEGAKMTADQGWSERWWWRRPPGRDLDIVGRVGLDLGAPGVGPPTACPGWSVRDQFPHLIGIERMLPDGGGSHLERALGRTRQERPGRLAMSRGWPCATRARGEDCGRVGGAHAHGDAVGPRPHAAGVCVCGRVTAPRWTPPVG